jgi:hypothetical protein
MHRRLIIKKTWLSASSYAQSRISLIFCHSLGLLVPWFSSITADSDLADFLCYVWRRNRPFFWNICIVLHCNTFEIIRVSPPSNHSCPPPPSPNDFCKINKNFLVCYCSIPPTSLHLVVVGLCPQCVSGIEEVRAGGAFPGSWFKTKEVSHRLFVY